MEIHRDCRSLMIGVCGYCRALYYKGACDFAAAMAALSAMKSARLQCAARCARREALRICGFSPVEDSVAVEDSVVKIDDDDDDDDDEDDDDDDDAVPAFLRTERLERSDRFLRHSASKCSAE